MNKNEYQKQVHSQVLQNVLRRVEKSFDKFFTGAGYPRFQGRNRYDNFTFPQSGFKITDEGKLKLSKIGEIKIVQHRLRQSEKKLVKAQRELSKKKKRSNNRDKQRVEVAKIHRKIRNQREDFNHKLSRELVNNYDTIVFEDLQIKNMVKNHNLAKSISDAGWSQLIQFTTYKAEYAGRIVDLVNPRNTSKTCSICGHIQSMSLSERTYKCLCGNLMDRDHNAAINILNRAVGTTVQDCGGHLNREPTKQEAPSVRVG
ncbi:MAG: IS200/IS605 family element transposase accessory protein TnpB [ANME-2 cluster archaeon]|nr:IS200/IS605 family element transposase accessory protein TnpB [ANME-2 cluster archaeon]MBC2702806.1 IS200/IS605 family element transposase accessory protein TnpB [ANME-2 cluster archaeon]MBC2706314.1 IS200/IS605 family element transposase accessory protein TnpB [ANME-2 cluster archaeon]MBC2747132.1 IS200/IS605 family element transposase accessory protein TnpB [ANME-2 cluster archaeon]